MNEKDIKDMTARELLESAIKELNAVDEELEWFLLVVKTEKSDGFSLCGRMDEIARMLTAVALKKKELRPIIHQASVALKLLERVYDAEASDNSAAITLTKEQLEQLQKKGGKA